MKMNIKPAFRYQFSSFLKSASVVYLIFVLIVVAFLIGTPLISVGSSTTINFTGTCIVAAIFLFVTGITCIRSDLRLCLQYGVSRRTAFVSELLALLSISVVVAVLIELLTGLAQIFLSNNVNIYFADLYQIIYLDPDIKVLSLGQHILSALFNVSLICSFCIAGMFFSLLFWRLNKLLTVVVAISIPVLINAVPALLYRAGVNFKPLFDWALSSPFCFMLLFLLLAVLFGIIDWLLLRRANINAAK